MKNPAKKYAFLMLLILIIPFFTTAVFAENETTDIIPDEESRSITDKILDVLLQRAEERAIEEAETKKAGFMEEHNIPDNIALILFFTIILVSGFIVFTLTTGALKWILLGLLVAAVIAYIRLNLG